MSPQFVDFNADGHLDIVAGIFDGSPHVAFGDGKGWQQPVGILDKDGARIVMNDFWNFDTKKWDATTRCDPAGAAVVTGHLTSTWAADWDGDGDFDLLLGDHKGGQVMVRINEGSNAQPSFATKNVPVLAGGKPMVVPGTVTTLRLVDWNGDGVQDLLVGSMGDSYGNRTGGGVFVYLNEGSDAAPKFDAATTLIEPSAKGAAAPARPDSGLYMDVGDVDGDGDLDLIVGGYAIWTPPAPALDAAQQVRVAELQKELADLNAVMQDFYKSIEEATKGLDEAAATAKRAELLKERNQVFQEMSKKRAAVQRELEPLTPGQKRKSFTWLYENLGKGAVDASARR
ncbi:MAG: VCBS repeat-containing protein [Planctomycetes bacterium]|nr:VCBS repeat-containing protein [Planctomycetota bacterium]MCB9885394.1 VCBS repeat-containing protein [Planctomycetota bacterium]